jgi:citrate synthase
MAQTTTPGVIEETGQAKGQAGAAPPPTVRVILDGKEYELPVVVGSEGEKAIDISHLRSLTRHITLDPGYGNTGACESAITFIDGERGILRYRGYPIEEIAGNTQFTDVCYLLVYGHLPNRQEYTDFRARLTYHSLIHEDMKKFFEGYPPSAHPMAILSAMVASLSTYYPSRKNEDLDLNIIRLLAKAKTIAAFAYKKNIGQPFIYPRNDLSYCANFLHMMFAVPAEPYEVRPVLDRALNLLLILHADHEQNCSTSTVRMVGSSEANLWASISAGICALWGPLHGGANQAVIEMLERIQADGGNYRKYVEMAKDKGSGFRLMGFGHRVYKNFDPRARILKKTADEVLGELGVKDPLLDIAKALEEVALHDDFFIERKLYPNVDFYSGIIYRAMGIPTSMFTVMFALGRLPGWLAHWKEMRADPATRINRPRQVYVGPTERKFVPPGER